MVKILNSASSEPVTARYSLLSAPALGPASSVQANAPKNGGVTNEAITRARIDFLNGKSVRVTNQASRAPMTTAIAPTQEEMINVFQIALRNCSLVKTSIYLLNVNPPSLQTLARKIAPSGKSIKKTTKSAAPIHTGRVGSLK